MQKYILKQNYFPINNILFISNYIYCNLMLFLLFLLSTLILTILIPILYDFSLLMHYFLTATASPLKKRPSAI